MGLPTTGAPAPAFSLQDHTGAEVSLSDYQGKKNVLVYFYPKAMTPGCTVQAQVFAILRSNWRPRHCCFWH